MASNLGGSNLDGIDTSQTEGIETLSGYHRLAVIKFAPPGATFLTVLCLSAQEDLPEMTKARLLIVLALSLTVVSATAFAQAPVREGRPGFGGPGMLPHEIMKDLSVDQKSQVQSIAKAAHEKQEALDNQALTQKEYRAQSMQIHKDARTQMESVLTPDQKAKLASIEASHRGPGGPRGPQPERQN
jgi:Spy/CpxP family protein refolding chaperone